MTIWINEEVIGALEDIGNLDLYLFRRLPLPQDDEGPLRYKTLDDLVEAGQAVDSIRFDATITEADGWTYLEVPEFDPVAFLNEGPEPEDPLVLPMTLPSETFDVVAVAAVDVESGEVLYVTDNLFGRVSSGSLVYPAKDENGRRWLLKWRD